MILSAALIGMVVTSDPGLYLPLEPPPSPTKATMVPWHTQDDGCCASSELSVMTLGADSCWVKVGDLDMGRAPFFRKSIPAGECVARIQCEDGRRWAARVKLRPGKSERVLVRAQDWEQTPRTSQLSLLTLGETGCQVKVGEESLGEAPVFTRSVPEGFWTVRVSCPSGKEYRRRIELKPGIHHRVMLGQEEWVGPPATAEPIARPIQS